MVCGKNSFFRETQRENWRFLVDERDPWCSLSVIFCGFVSHLIGHETINIPTRNYCSFSVVHCCMGKTVKCMYIDILFLLVSNYRPWSNYKSLICNWIPVMCGSILSFPLVQIPTPKAMQNCILALYQQSVFLWRIATGQCRQQATYTSSNPVDTTGK